MHIPYKHFEIEIFELAVRLITEGDFTVDLYHAYYSVKIAEEQHFFFFHGKKIYISLHAFLMVPLKVLRF